MMQIRIPAATTKAATQITSRARRVWRHTGAAWRVALAFCALVTASNLVLDHAGGAIAVQGDAWGALQQIQACEARTSTPDVVILGSSRAQAGIAPPVIESELASRLGRPIIACDLAVTTSVPLEDYFILRRLISDGVHPRFIIYATADYAFNSAIVDRNTPVQDNVTYLTTLGDLPDLAQSHVASGTGGILTESSWYLNFIAARLVRFYADRRGFEIALCQHSPAFGPCPGILPGDAETVSSPQTPERIYPIDRAEGWYPLPEATARSLANSAWQYTGWLANYHVSSEALGYLGRIVALARQQHAGIILVNTPILPQHLTFFPAPTDYLEYLRAIERFSVVQRVPFYDFGLDYDDNLADFADTNHLNYWGALAFTGMLAADVVTPEYQAQVLGR